MKTYLVAASIAAVSVSSALAQQTPAVTVESLLKSGFTVAGIMPSAVGVGIFLVKGGQMYGCFAVETSKSPDIATKYCKPVH